MEKNSSVTGVAGSMPIQPAVIIEPESDLVAVNLPGLRTRLRDSIRLGAREITIDLSKTEMVDSAGMGLLISTHNSLKNAGGSLQVINASQDVLELLMTMRLHQHFSIKGKE